MANLTITKVSDGYFGFTDDADNVYGGNKIEYWYDAVNIYFKINAQVYTYIFEEVSYDDGNETIGFASTIELISTLKSAGFTGNFNTGGATPQVNYSETEQDTGIKWLNNKPIYQKTFVFNVTVGGVFIDTSSIGIEKCIKLESTFNDGGAIYPLPYTLFDNSSVTPSNIIFISKYSMEDGTIVGQFTYNVGTVVTNVSGEFIVTMYYTKI